MTVEAGGKDPTSFNYLVLRISWVEMRQMIEALEIAEKSQPDYGREKLWLGWIKQLRDGDAT